MPNAGNAHLAPVRWAGRRGSTPPGARGSLERERAVIATERVGRTCCAVAAATWTSAAGRAGLPARDGIRRRSGFVPRGRAFGGPRELHREQVHGVGPGDEPVRVTFRSTDHHPGTQRRRDLRAEERLAVAAENGDPLLRVRVGVCAEAVWCDVKPWRESSSPIPWRWEPGRTPRDTARRDPQGWCGRPRGCPGPPPDRRPNGASRPTVDDGTERGQPVRYVSSILARCPSVT